MSYRFDCLLARDGTSSISCPLAMNLYDIYLMLYVQPWTPDDGRKDRAKHVEWYSINPKIVHLVGFTREIYWDSFYWFLTCLHDDHVWGYMSQYGTKHSLSDYSPTFMMKMCEVIWLTFCKGNLNSETLQCKAKGYWRNGEDNILHANCCCITHVQRNAEKLPNFF